MDCIFIEGIELEGKHGHFDDERQHGNKFRVDIRLYLDLSKPASTDNLDDTADYSRAAAIAAEVFAGPSVKLVETLAAKISDRILAEMPLVQEAMVSVAKLNPQMNPPATEAGVEVLRTR